MRIGDKRALAVAGALVVVACCAYWTWPHPVAVERDDGERSEGPPDGDYWAIRAGYPSMRYDPAWLVASARQNARIRAAVPAGGKGYSRSAASPLALDPAAFTPLGPQPLNNTQMQYGAVSGRINTIAVDPVDPSVAYIGSDGGGVWKTSSCCSATPGGTTWAVKTDIPEIASSSIGDITIDPSNHNVVYAGTGDLNYGSFSFGAAGVLKSTDQGETWSLLGADVFTPFYDPSANGFPQYQAIGKVVVDPNNSGNVIVGTKTGLWFSYDAGEHWSGPCFTNPFHSGPDYQRQDTTGLLAVNRGGNTVLYAAIGTRGTPTPVQPDLDRTGANAVYPAAMPASGCPASWALLNSGWPANTGNGVTNNGTDIGRIELAVAPSDSTVLYAMAASSASRNVLGVWRSADGGTSWTRVAASSSAVAQCGSDSSSAGGGTQMWYDAGLTVDPVDANRVYLSGFDLYRSTNGGASFVNLTCGWTTKPSGSVDHVHVDHHARAFVGADPDRLLIGSDGGVYYSANATQANPQLSFTSLNGSTAAGGSGSLNTIEFYFGDITSNFAASANPKIGAGAQDNGCSYASFSGSPTGAVMWTSTCGGDGTTTRIEPINNSAWFNSSQNGALARNLNGPAGAYSSVSANTGGTWGGDTLSFMMSYDIYKWGDTAVPGSGCSASGCNHMIAGTTRLWETVDALNSSAATTRASWKARTTNLTKNSLVLGSDNRSYINSVAYAFTDPGVAVVGTNDGNVQYVFGLGTAATANCATPGSDPNCATAVNVTGGNAVLPNRPVQDVVVDPRDARLAYAALGGFDQNTPATPGHVFRVSCTAACASFEWADKSGNLPNIPVNAIMANPKVPGQVFAGTDWGLYFTDNIDAATPVWFRFEGLPHVMIWDLVVDRGFTTLAAFTRSRGAWAWPLLSATDRIFADDFQLH